MVNKEINYVSGKCVVLCTTLLSVKPLHQVLLSRKHVCLLLLIASCPNNVGVVDALCNEVAENLSLPLGTARKALPPPRPLPKKIILRRARYRHNDIFC